MAAQPSIVAWEITWTEEPGGQQSMASQKESDMAKWLNNNNNEQLIRSRHYLKFFICIGLKLITTLSSTITILLNYLHKVMELIDNWEEFQSQFPGSRTCVFQCATWSGNTLQYSCLGNSVDRGAWWATVHGVIKSQTQMSDFHFTSCGPNRILSLLSGQGKVVGFSEKAQLQRKLLNFKQKLLKLLKKNRITF